MRVRLNVAPIPHPAFPVDIATEHLADRFIEGGIDSLEDHEILELLFSMTLSDGEHTREARTCIANFQSLRGALHASSEELLQCGMSPLVVLCIRLVSEIPARVMRQKLARGAVLESPQEVYDYLNCSMRDLRNEVFRTIYLDGANRIIETLDVAEGTPNSVAVFPRQVLERAIRYGATSMLLAHNHPAGNPLPSRKDKMLTRDMVFLGKALQVEVLDHIIVGDNSHFSFFDEGLITQYEDSFLTLRRRATA